MKFHYSIWLFHEICNIYALRYTCVPKNIIFKDEKHPKKNPLTLYNKAPDDYYN